MQKLTIEYIPLNTIKPYKRNAKKHPDEQVKQIADSIAKFGMNDPIAIDESNSIIEGHGRLLAIQELKANGLYDTDTVPVIRLEHLTEQQKKAYILIHNKLTLDSGFDLDVLRDELNNIFEVDMSEFGFDLSFLDNSDDFLNNKHEYNTREGTSEEYQEFLEKFDAKKTTDDCYTPDNIYEAVAGYVAERYGLNRDDFVRPFYPGGDYQKYKYKPGAVVVDNPPFSILSEILKFFQENNINFFLFAPTLTLFSSSSSSSTCIALNVVITYDNGANVSTSFVTSLEPDIRFRTDPDLYKIMQNVNNENLKKLHAQLPSYVYPPYVVTSSGLGYLSKWGQDFAVKRNESYYIKRLDSQKEYKKVIFGAGYLISEAQAKAQAKAQAQAQAQAQRNDMIWELSEREKEIIKKLNKQQGE